MSALYKHSRAVGGHLIHAREPGSHTALCGFMPSTTGVRCRAGRSGWVTATTLCSITCRKCKAEIEAKDRAARSFYDETLATP